MTFLVETMPCEGRNPKIPQYPAGTLTLPPVSVPIKRKMNKKENHHIDFFHQMSWLEIMYICVPHFKMDCVIPLLENCIIHFLPHQVYYKYTCTHVYTQAYTNMHVKYLLDKHIITCMDVILNSQWFEIQSDPGLRPPVIWSCHSPSLLG